METIIIQVCSEKKGWIKSVCFVKGVQSREAERKNELGQEAKE